MMTEPIRLAGLLAVFIASTLNAQEAPVSDEAGEAPAPAPEWSSRRNGGFGSAADRRPSRRCGVAAGGTDDRLSLSGSRRTGSQRRSAPQVRVVASMRRPSTWACGRFDSRPNEIVPGERIRDYDVVQSDNVILIFDTYKDEQNGFVFGTTPAGIEYDGQVRQRGSGWRTLRRRRERQPESFPVGCGRRLQQELGWELDGSDLPRRGGVVRRVPIPLQHLALRHGEPVMGLQRSPPDPTAKRGVLLVSRAPGVQSLPFELRR